MYQLEEPKYFIALIVIPILIVTFLGMYWWKKRTQKKFADSFLIKKLSPEKSTFKSILKIVVLSLGLAFLVIALVNPKMGTKLETIKRQGVDIVFALDISKSMLAEDIAPSRLQKAKQIIDKVIDKLGSDRIGIIAYAGNAYPLLPITTDHGAAKIFLQNADPNLVSSQGTSINDALQLAETYYNNDEQTNKFLILISDGEDHQGVDNSIVAKAAKDGIKIYTISVGTEKGGPIPLKHNGRVVEYKRDREGNVVNTKMDPKMLMQIAEEGNGEYLNGNSTKNTVDAIQDILVKADKNEFESKQFSDYKSQFQWFLGIGLILLIIDLLLFEKKTKWIQKLNLFNEK
ncbi:VWA domain-containing protein [Aureivirga sp. CE67]|uniref:VWA domain-containing protein n=1 Tax=Aureivirga sp. CE67 TaxID=1788983 RepID=UPI0018CA3367|nr:VWA domain-containing protein [Aureivirga sp. CE67]